MLKLNSQFNLKSAVKSPLFLLNPPALTEEEVELPRYSVVHYLDTTSDIHFPNRDLNYLRPIPKNKKVPVYHITDLDLKEDTTSLLNKYVHNEVRKWNMAHLKEFREIPLLEVPNKDSVLIPVYNYNLLKDLYRYKASMLSKFNRYNNLYTTYWNHVKKAIAADTESIQFVSFSLPNHIPNYNIIDIMMQFNTIKFSRVVSDDNLFKVIDLYRWLTNDTRASSTLKDITDEESLRITVEFKYKGYVCYLPLHILRSLAEESSLENNIKYKNIKLKKIFVLMLHRFQDKVNALQETDETSDSSGSGIATSDETPDNTDTRIMDVIDDDVDDVKIDETDDTDPIGSFPEIAKLGDQVYRKQDLDKINKAIDINLDLDTNSVDAIITRSLNKFEEDSADTDLIYEETIQKVLKEEDVPVEAFTVDYNEETTQKRLSEKTLDTAFDKHVNEAVTFKTLTTTEIRSLKKLKENRTLLNSPYHPDKKLDEVKVVTNEEKQLTEEKTTLAIQSNFVNDNLKKEVINVFDREYINHTLKKDVIACVSNLEKSGIIIKNYEVEESRSALGVYEVHKLTLKPFNGKESTVYFRLPRIDSEGEFLGSGIKYTMRKLRQPLPIVKVSPIRVALTSNYSKLFISRTERKTNDPHAYIIKYIQTNYLESTGLIDKLIPGKKNLSQTNYPNIYTVLASEFNEVHTSKVVLITKPKEINNYITENVVKDLDNKSLTFCGYLANKEILVIDQNDHFYNYTNALTPLGDIYDLFELDREKTPKPFTTIKVLGDDIPLGVSLSYYLGLTGLIGVTQTEYQLIERSKQYKPQRDELVLKFSDYKLILKVDTKEKELLFNGFLFYRDFIKAHTVKEFDYKEIYLNVLEFRDSNLIHIKELNLLEELFLDPITVDVLKSMNEPTEFLKLLLRANYLLRDLSHPDINDPNHNRIRGYDRVPGLMYRALAESVRDFKIKGRSNSKIELDPYKVWNYITQDSTVKITEDINPILDIKESEALTLSGADGVSKDATPAGLRRYHKNDIGLVSESTVDSSDVALNTYLSPYAKIKDTRGLINKESTAHTENKAKVFSTSALLSPMVEFDDVRRINFISVQNSHTIYSSGYQQPILRTGYEYMIPFKAGKLYAVMAEQDGQVIDVTDHLITVKYKDNTVKTYKIGKLYGNMEGGVYPHQLVTTRIKGTKLKAGDHIAYNQNFFEPDWLDPSKLVLKFGRNVTVALTMTNEVFEDSSAISQSLSEEMSTYIIKQKNFIIEFNKNLINILPEGSPVEPNTVLFTILDGEADYSNLSDSSINMLQNLASLAPKAKYNGVVDRYEVRYNGELSDLSPSLRKFVNKLDKQTYEESKGTEYEVTNNKVSSEYRSEGRNLNVDTLELKVYIKVKLNQASGDKGVFSSQLKTVTSDVFTYNINTETGTPVEALFAYKGILGRVVQSPVIAGTTNRLVKHVSKQLVDLYFS
jgi:hypothetical protein